MTEEDKLQEIVKGYVDLLLKYNPDVVTLDHVCDHIIATTNKIIVHKKLIHDSIKLMRNAVYFPQTVARN